jgi:hypothetical protein
MAVQIKWRRDTASNWTSNNPMLAQGEPGFETDTGKYKIGDGSSSWNSLSYGDFSDEAIAIMLADQASGNDPSPPASGKLLLYAKTIAGRMMLKQEGLFGIPTAIQPFLARNKVGYWIPPGNATTVPGVFGYTAPTAIGTATAANVATTNQFTMMRRLSYVSNVTAGTFFYAGQRVNAAQISIGPGFYKIVRFGISDPVLVSPANMFIGVSATTAAPSGGTEPSALVNLIGVGHNSTDSNLQIFYGGTTAQPQIDLGPNFPINTTNTDAYELALYSPVGSDFNVYYEVTRINTGDVVSGVIEGDGGGVVLPAPNLLLDYGWHWRCNMAGSTAVSLDIMSSYIETDN